MSKFLHEGHGFDNTSSFSLKTAELKNITAIHFLSNMRFKESLLNNFIELTTVFLQL